MPKSPRKHSTSPAGKTKLSIRFGQREEDGGRRRMFMDYREEDANGMEREALGEW